MLDVSLFVAFFFVACCFFFFSSRRRHTRWTGDWSSDVCSSDLGVISEAPQAVGEQGAAPAEITPHGLELSRVLDEALEHGLCRHLQAPRQRPEAHRFEPEIGRASCRERGEISGGGVCLKKKNEK